MRKYGPILDGLKPHNRDRNYCEHLKTILAVKPRGRLLDIGTHCGFFLRLARNQDWKLYGIEPSPTNAMLAREKFGLDVRASYLEDDIFPLEFFDVVTMINVLDHVTTPLTLLSIVRKILKPDGILFIKVPNAYWSLLKYRFPDRVLKSKNLDIFDSRERVVHYSEETLAMILEKAGLVVKKFYIPRPIQTGEWWMKAGRIGAWSLANIAFFCTGKLGPFATDLACLAERAK